MGVSDQSRKKILAIKKRNACCAEMLGNYEWIISEYGTDNEVATIILFMSISDINAEVKFPQDMAINIKICKKKN